MKGCIDSNHESYIFYKTSYSNKNMTDILRKLTFFQLTLSLNQSLTFFFNKKSLKKNSRITFFYLSDIFLICQ